MFHTLPTFDIENPKADLSPYLKTLERLWKRTKWSEYTFVFAARQKFTGTILRALEMAGVSKWKELRDVLISQFGVNQATAEDRMNQLRKKKSQSVSEYANEFRYLRSLSYPADATPREIRTYEKTTEARAIRAFIEGLGGTLAEKTHSRAPQTLNEAIKAVTHEEMSPANRYAKTLGEIHNIETSQMICYSCKKPGHRAAMCRNATPPPQQPQPLIAYRYPSPTYTPQRYNNFPRQQQYQQQIQQQPSDARNIRNTPTARALATASILNINPAPSKCYRCGGQGHFANSCGTPPTTRQRPTNNSNYARTYGQAAEQNYQNPNQLRKNTAINQQGNYQPQQREGYQSQYRNQGSVPRQGQHFN